jgi:hypothetical protein
MTTLVSISTLADTSSKVRFTGKVNQYGILSCEQHSSTGTTEVSSDKCISERRFVTTSSPMVYGYCFQQGLVMTKDGSSKWIFIDSTGYDAKNCLQNKSAYFATEEFAGQFKCFEKAMVLEVRKDGEAVPVWKTVDYAGRDQALCSGRNERYVATIRNGMVDGCYKQAAVTLASGEVKWLSYNSAGRDVKNCVVEEKCVQNTESKEWFKQVSVKTEQDQTEWIYLNFLRYSDNTCEVFK